MFVRTKRVRPRYGHRGPDRDTRGKIADESISQAAPACVLSMTANHSVKATSPRARVPPSCVVPKVVGKSLANARAAITRAHCKVGSITRTQLSARTRGKVVGQSPAARRRLRNGAKVNLTVGRG